MYEINGLLVFNQEQNFAGLSPPEPDPSEAPAETYMKSDSLL
jgi:hypothetical protein